MKFLPLPLGGICRTRNSMAAMDCGQDGVTCSVYDMEPLVTNPYCPPHSPQGDLGQFQTPPRLFMQSQIYLICIVCDL